MPLPSEPAAAGGLRLGDDDRSLFGARAREIARHALGRIDLREPVDTLPTPGEVGRQLRGPEPVSGAQPEDVIERGDTLVGVGKAGQFLEFRRLLAEGPFDEKAA